MENSVNGKFNIGDSVIMNNPILNLENSSYYPIFGTYGKITGIDDKDCSDGERLCEVKWADGSCKSPFQWWCYLSDLKVVTA